LQVRGGVENLIADEFVIASWRLQRLERIEAEAFTRYGLSSKGEVMGPGFAMIATVQGDNFLSTLGRYEAGLRRQYFRCLDTLQALRKGHLFDYFAPPVLDVETVPPRRLSGRRPARGSCDRSQFLRTWRLTSPRLREAQATWPRGRLARRVRRSVAKAKPGP